MAAPGGRKRAGQPAAGPGGSNDPEHRTRREGSEDDEDRRDRALNRMTVLLALAGLAACGQGADTGAGDADAAEGEVASEVEAASQPGDTSAAPPRPDVDDPDIVPEPTGADAAADSVAAEGDVADTIAPDTSQSLGPPLRIPGGTEVTVTSDFDISTDEYDVGDAVIATVVEEVVARDGTVLIPQGVKLLGRVEAATGSGGVGELPVLELSFETLSAWSFERPIETLVTHTPVTIDPEADRARRQAGGRDAMRVLPGRITAGSIIMLQLREAVFVPRDAPMWLLWDSLGVEGVRDSLLRLDTVPGVDTVLRRNGVEP